MTWTKNGIQLYCGFLWFPVTRLAWRNEVYHSYIYGCIKKIGTHCVHVASQEKHQHRVFINEKETSRCNIIYISNAYMQCNYLIQWYNSNSTIIILTVTQSNLANEHKILPCKNFTTVTVTQATFPTIYSFLWVSVSLLSQAFSRVWLKVAGLCKICSYCV